MRYSPTIAACSAVPWPMKHDALRLDQVAGELGDAAEHDLAVARDRRGPAGIAAAPAGCSKISLSMKCS